jgi:HAD superfamily hydrolase (TIGR01484 family)
MGNVKLVVTDIDGTMVRERTPDVSPAVHGAMRAVQAAGVTVAAATARPYEMAQELFAKLGFAGPCIFDGGASIRDVQTGKLLWNNWLDVPRLRAIAEIVFPHSRLIDFSPDFKYQEIKDAQINNIVEPAPYGWCLMRRSALRYVIEALEEIGGLNVHQLAGWPEYPDYVDMQITDANSDKFHAVEALREVLHITQDQTLAIGDAGNDVPLLKAAGIKVAMGNATTEVKALADYVVATVEDDGWAEAMQKFVLA